MKLKTWALVSLRLALITGSYAQAGDATDDIETLKKQIQELDQKVRVLERNRELEKEAADAKKSDTPRLSAGQDGFSFSSADTNFVLRVGAHVQADGRFYLGDHIPVNDTFLLRRVRPIFEGTVYKDFDYRLMLDFGANTSGPNTVQEAYANFHHWTELQLQVGKFKPPVGLERLQSDVNVRFIERGYPTGLVPNRDVGIELHGELFKGALNYQAGIFNGVADGGSGDVELADDHKDYAARIFIRPLKNTGIDPLRGLGLGVAGTYGNQNGALPKYVTPGQQTFFSYLTLGSGNAFTNATAGGKHWRLVPQGYWYWGPFGVLGEYALSSQKVRLDSKAGAAAPTTSAFTTVRNDGWQVATSWVLTGEDNTFQGVKPKRAFNISEGTWGAWEVAGRVGQLSVDDRLFPSYAAAGSASRASSWGAGINWYLNRNLRLALDYEQTQFKNGSNKPGTVTGQDEKIIFSRVQVAF